MTHPYHLLRERIDERFPEGLTGAFCFGATRTSYILEHNRESENPGKIEDFHAYLRYSVDHYLQIVQTFFEMGGRHAFVGGGSYELFEDKRGPEYIELLSKHSSCLFDETTQAFYREHNIDPYFAGIELLFLKPEDSAQHRLGREIENFQRNWEYQDGRHKLIWEVVPMPLYSFRFADEILGEREKLALEKQLAIESNYSNLYEILYRYYATVAYGTDFPKPQFYLASNRNGDLKARAFLPFSLDAKGDMRLYFTPYPSFFMKPETLETILEDLLVDKRLRSFSDDYKNRLSQEDVQQLYQYFQELANDPMTTQGISKNVLLQLEVD